MEYPGIKRFTLDIGLVGDDAGASDSLLCLRSLFRFPRCLDRWVPTEDTSVLLEAAEDRNDGDGVDGECDGYTEADAFEWREADGRWLDCDVEDTWVKPDRSPGVVVNKGGKASACCLGGSAELD
jgi:hypothetical protein